MGFIVPAALLVLATILEAGGDAVIRMGLKLQTLPIRVLLLMIGAGMLTCYGLTLNLGPLDWGRLIGAYVAVFFVVAQLINLVAFHVTPSLPIIIGGVLILTGGAVITLWQP